MIVPIDSVFDQYGARREEMYLVRTNGFHGASLPPTIPGQMVASGTGILATVDNPPRLNT